MRKSLLAKLSQLGFILATVVLLNGCFISFDPHLGTEPADYEREGMNPNQIEVWEDGLRTSMLPGTFEWWYFDAEMEDGTKVVVVYYTKNMFDPALPTVPQMTVDITPPGEPTIKVRAEYTPEQSSFSTQGFNVVIGPNYGFGDLNQYVIHAEVEDIVVDLVLDRIAPSWRPGNGHFYFGEQQEEFFAWLPSVPKGDIAGQITYGGNTYEVSGSGYHDHNWGNAKMSDLLSNWWWTRADIDGNTVIAAELLSKPVHGAKKLPVFVVASDTEILADGAWAGASMTLLESDVQAHPDPNSVEEIAHQLEWQYRHQDTSIDILMSVTEVLSSSDLLLRTSLKQWQIDLARALGVSPWYTRFFTDAEMTMDFGDGETVGTGFSVLEKMDFE